MTTSDLPNWQTQHSANEGRWQDLKRRRSYTLPIILLALFSTGYAFLFTASRFDDWFPSTTSLTVYWLFRSGVVITKWSPVILAIIGVRFIRSQVYLFIADLYKPADGEDIPKLLKRKLLGIPPYPPPLSSFIKYPFLIIKDTSSLKENHWARWFGGPAVLIIHDGLAVYLERENQFSRVLGPGMPMPLLDRNETIKEIIDLKPQIKEAKTSPWTKDGINITLHVRAELQINASEEALENSQDLQFPFDPLAVKQVVEGITVRLDDKNNLYEYPWLDGAWGTVTGSINGFVSGHSLDELFIAPIEEYNASLNHHGSTSHEEIEQILSKKISETVITGIRNQLNKNGLNILGLQITQVEVPKEVKKIREKYWESLHKKISAQRNSHAEAEWIRAREQIHAEAQRTMLTTIINRLEHIPEDQLTESLTLSLSGILDQNLEDPLIRPLIAKEALAVLDRMRKFLNEEF